MILLKQKERTEADPGQEEIDFGRTEAGLDQEGTDSGRTEADSARTGTTSGWTGTYAVKTEALRQALLGDAVNAETGAQIAESFQRYLYAWIRELTGLEIFFRQTAGREEGILHDFIGTRSGLPGYGPGGDAAPGDMLFENRLSGEGTSGNAKRKDVPYENGACGDGAIGDKLSGNAGCVDEQSGENLPGNVACEDESSGEKLYGNAACVDEASGDITTGAVVSRLIIGYCTPKHFSEASDQMTAIRQMRTCLKDRNAFGHNRYHAVLTDGLRICYFDFHGEDLENTGVKQIQAEDVDRLIRALLSCGKKKFVSENILRDFSVEIAPDSVSRKLAKALYERLCRESSPEAERTFREWVNLAHFSCGESGTRYEIDRRRKELSQIFQVPIKERDQEYRALFALQTAYAIIVKLIAGCMIRQREQRNPLMAFVSQEREVFADRTDFPKPSSVFPPERDFFSWYLEENEWGEDLEKAVHIIRKCLDAYSSFSFEISYEPTDIFRDLYMSIIPESVRYSMGEYFTPEWMADYVVTEGLKLQEKKNWRALDPCCGSGTFLLSLIRHIVGDVRLQELSEDEKKAIRERILSSVYGIDINPLSVLTARVGYRLALLPFGTADDTEIPVFCGDSAVMPMEDFIGKPGDFDLIVGNPPWVKWEHLPSEYAKKIRELCNVRHIFSTRGRFGGTQLNICALIANVTAANWLRKGGVQAFLMPDSILSQNSYEEFRYFYLDYKSKQRLYLQKLDKWEKPLRPFRCGGKMVVQDFNTYYYSDKLVDYKKGVDVTTISRIPGVSDLELNRKTTFAEISDFLIFGSRRIAQMSEKTSAFSYLSETHDFSRIMGASDYEFRTGVEFTPQELYMLVGRGPSKDGGHYLFDNRKFRRSRYEVQDEPAGGWNLPVTYIFPIVTGPSLSPFRFEDRNEFCILPYSKEKNDKPVGVEELLRDHDRLFQYLLSHQDLIESQSQKSKEMHRGEEFYALSKIGSYTFAPWLVAARDNTNFCASVIGQAETPWGERKQRICVKHTMIISRDLTGREITEEEAYYICGILNSAIVVDYMHSTFKSNGYSLKKAQFYLPLFDGANALHKRIAQLAKEASAEKGTSGKKMVQTVSGKKMVQTVSGMKTDQENDGIREEQEDSGFKTNRERSRIKTDQEGGRIRAIQEELSGLYLRICVERG